jgi:NADPH2:quinone reductase
VLRRRLTITGSTLRPRPVAFKGPSPRAAREGLAAAGGRPHQAGDRAGVPGRAGGEAHALMESSQHVGKIVLDWAA